MQETEFNAVRLLIAPTHHRVLTKVTFPTTGNQNVQWKKSRPGTNTYLYNRAEGYIEIIPHNNQAGRRSNKDKLIKHEQVLPLNIQGGGGKTISGS